MKFKTLFLVPMFLLAACETTNVYPTKVVEVQASKSDEETKVVEKKIDCASIDPSFKQVGDTCVSICVECIKNGGQCIDTNKNGYGDTCVSPAPVECFKVKYAYDHDRDGHGDPNSTWKLACEGLTDAAWVLVGDDCNDDDASVYPGADELCDGIDNNCDGVIDSLLGQENTKCVADGKCYAANKDKLGLACTGNYGVCAVGGVLECATGTTNLICSTDINGSASKATQEVCGDNLDNNCNGLTDEDCPDCAKTDSFANNVGGCTSWCDTCIVGKEECKDTNGNGFGDSCVPVVQANPNDDNDNDGFTALDDCNDNDASIQPGLDNCPVIDQLTKYSYKLVLVWGNKADANWPYKNTLKYKQELSFVGGGYNTTDLTGSNWDSWQGAEFAKGTFVAIDLDPAVKFIRFNEFEYPGKWMICNAAKVNDTSVDFNTLNLPTIYVVKNGVWEDVTAKIGMQAAVDTMSNGPMPKSTSPSGYPQLNYCSATLTF
jgi:hypothetical protein